VKGLARVDVRVVGSVLELSKITYHVERDPFFLNRALNS
jgi:hypothetical protein